MAAKPGPFRLDPSSAGRSADSRQKVQPLPLSASRTAETAQVLRPSESAQAIMESIPELPRQDYERLIAEKVIDPFRCFDCSNYESCLNLAAVLNWPSFTCKGCNGVVDHQLLWRAHQELKKKRELQSLCSLPALETVEPE